MSQEPILSGGWGGLERGRRTNLRAIDFADVGGAEVLIIERSPDRRAEEQAQWYTLNWTLSVASDASRLWMPQLLIRSGTDTGRIQVRADAACGSLTVLARLNVGIYVAPPADDPIPISGAEGGQPSVFQIFAAPSSSWRGSEATMTRFFSLAGAVGPAPGYGPAVARAAGSLSVTVTSTNLGAARSLVLEESTDGVFAAIVARTDVSNGQRVTLQGRSRYLRVANYSATPDTSAIVSLLDGL